MTADVRSFTSSQLSTLGNEMTGEPRAASRQRVRHSRRSTRFSITITFAAVDSAGATFAGSDSCGSGLDGNTIKDIGDIDPTPLG